MRRALAALFLSTACHTPEWRVEQIHEQIAAFNDPRREAAVKSALEANHATLSAEQPKTIFFRSDMNECVDLEVVVATDDGRTLVAPCNTLRNAIFSGGAMEAKLEDGGAPVVLAAAAPLAGDRSGAFAIATGPNGERYLIRPRIKVVHTRKIWRAGTCNFMPSPIDLPRTVRMFVLPPAVVRVVDVFYEGEDTEVVCDERVE